jgi:putative aldouronate transport system permease protein
MSKILAVSSDEPIEEPADSTLYKFHPQFYSRREKFTQHIKNTWQLYLLLTLPIVYLVIFNYYPMYGALLAFKKYRILKGILGSPWASNYGFENFIRFFKNYNFVNCLTNTFFISIYSLVAAFPFSIILALSLNYVMNTKFKKTIQFVSYAPYFISTIVLVGMINSIFNFRSGVFGELFYHLTGLNILASASAFPSLYVWTGVWQTIGFNAIIFIAALSGVDVQLHEAALIDGATIMQRIRNIDLPSIMPTAVILLILNMGGILNIGYEKILAMQNANNLRTSEVISTYAYKIALVSEIPDFPYATAIGLFQSLVGLILIISVNKICQRLSKESLW